MAHPAIRTNRWTRLSKALRTRWRAEGVACNICSRPITAEQAMDVDHVVPVADAPHLAYELSNLVPAHASCNRRKGRRAPRPKPTRARPRPECEATGEETMNTSRRWFGDPGTCLRTGDTPCPSTCPAASLVAQLDQG
jgi:5-methylcytosine-specific restriction endonuclease McrA